MHCFFRFIAHIFYQFFPTSASAICLQYPSTLSCLWVFSVVIWTSSINSKRTIIIAKSNTYASAAVMLFSCVQPSFSICSHSFVSAEWLMTSWVLTGMLGSTYKSLISEKSIVCQSIIFLALRIHSTLLYVTRRMLTHCKSVCQSASTKFSSGWCPTGCSLTLPRLRCSGVHLFDVNIRSWLVLFVLVTHLCCQYEQFETWWSTLMQMSPWVLTWLQSSKCVLQHSVRYAVCVVRWQISPCWH